jgi:3-dehydroquinate dehydratase/shikimate dehydrogenase
MLLSAPSLLQHTVVGREAPTFAAQRIERGVCVRVRARRTQDADTPVLGVIGNPIAHSKSPALHNAALAATGERGCYLPLLVDSLPGFLAAFDRDDFTGFSVTIPHKEAALAACAEVDPVAASIGAVNTLVRLPGGGFKGYNTDWEAAVDAIEMGLGGMGTLSGRSVMVLGAGGAARALVFGALARGASSVTVANRTLSRAQALAESAGVQVCAVCNTPAAVPPEFHLWTTICRPGDPFPDF